MHRVKTPEERGEIGAWANAARGVAALSVEQVVEQLASRGVQVSAATLRGIEGGSKKPGRILLRALSEVYGVIAPNGRPREAGDYTELVSATREQTEAIRDQTEAIERRTDVLEVMLAALLRAQGPSPQVLAEVAAAEAELAARREGATRRQPPAHDPVAEAG